MGFVKYASVSPIASRDASGKFTKHAHIKVASAYADDQRQLDVKALLAKVASTYDISANPEDYIFEAARAVTAEVPNENGDAFPKAELLRYNHLLLQPVYQTFNLKPHQVNHRAENPKTARGVVLDTTYNDLTASLDACPSCNNDTSTVAGRDPGGICCKKCGSVVKDEFVEALIAIDTRKDPVFAAGVKSGALNSLSMGCEAGFTVCSVCENVARTTQQFCKHIRAGNKKKMFKAASGQMVMAFEKCGETIFTELSRVAQPADPKAKQREVLASTESSLSVETELLSIGSRLAQVEESFKHNQTGGPPPSDPQDNDDKKKVDDDFIERLELIRDVHPELYREVKERVVPEDSSVPEKKTMGQYVMEQAEEEAAPMSEADLGLKPENGGIPHNLRSKASLLVEAELNAVVKEEENKVEDTNYKFANAYKDLSVSITPTGNVKVFNPDGVVYVVRPILAGRDINDVARDVLASIAQNGLTATANSFNAIASKHTAQVLQHHHEDFAGGREEGDKKGITEGGGFFQKVKPSGMAKSVLDNDGMTDASEHNHNKKNPSSDSITDDVYTDHGEENDMKDSVLEGGDGDGAQSVRKTKSLSNHTQEDIEVDRKKKAGSESLNNQDVAKKKKPWEAEVDEAFDGTPNAQKEQKMYQGKSENDKRTVNNSNKSQKKTINKSQKTGGTNPYEQEAIDLLTGGGSKDEMEENMSNADAWDAAEKTPGMPVTASGKCTSCGKSKCACKTAEGEDKDAAAIKTTEVPESDAQDAEQWMQDYVQKTVAAMTKTKAKLTPAAQKMLADMSAYIENAKMGMGSTPPPIPDDAGDDIDPNVKSAEIKKYTTRLERLYKNKFAKVQEELKTRIDAAEANSAAKLSRAMKLAARRASLNLEYAPMKAAMCDVLTSKMDLDHDTIYPGMEDGIATRLIEAGFSSGIDEQIDALIKRGSELLAMPEDAFKAIEADIKNTQPLAIQASVGFSVGARNDMRKAAEEGNMVIAPSQPVGEPISDDLDRSSIRLALGGTKVQRTGNKLNQK